jgi:hypothetical protein
MFSQSHSDIWLIGRTLFPFEAIQFDFMSGLPTQSTVSTGIYMGSGTNSSICNENGELLMYTNGIAIANKFGELMENGDSLNTGAWANTVGDNGYPVPQGAFFLQKPNDENIYYLFHMFIELTGGVAPLTRFYYTLIDMSYNDDLGKVIEKNVPLLTGDNLLNYDQATAVRHANGRDWWIMVPNHMGPEYFCFLLTPDGIEGPWTQEIGFKEPTDDFSMYFNGQRVFSSDGSRFADYDFLNYVQVFDFDRCTGLLSNPVLIDFVADPVINNGGAGITFSPSGRFLYVTRTNNGYSVFQYDLEAGDIPGSEIEIAHCPLIGQQVACSFDNMLLAPDGKIYIDGADTLSFHRINSPDEKGIDCDFDFQGFNLISSNPNPWFPYFPNYRLGALEGSECDSITTSLEVLVRPLVFFTLSPNPASGTVNLQYELQEGSNGYFIVSDMMGRETERHLVEEPVGMLRLAGYDAGLYLIRMVVDGKIVQSEKLVKQ